MLASALFGFALLPLPQVPYWRSLSAPCPQGGALFGAALEFLDFDADGFLDLAVGAPGEGTVYLFRGNGIGSLTFHAALQASGPVAACPSPRPASDEFGYALASGGFGDLGGGDKLYVGAPATEGPGGLEDGRVYVFGHGAPAGWRRITSFEPAAPDLGGRMGHSLTVGDFSGDTKHDLIVGAPRTPFLPGALPGEGRVYVFVGGGSAFDLRNPFHGQPGAEKGVFGISLHASDVDGDDDLDLVVGAENNPNIGSMQTGAVHVYFGPLPSVSVDLLDPSPCDDRICRFAKWVGSDTGCVVTGAPQKDKAPCMLGTDPERVGGAFLFRYDPLLVPPFRGVQLHAGTEQGGELLGARCILADRIGGPESDFVFATWGPPRELRVFDGVNPSLVAFIPAPPGIDPTAQHYWVDGIDAAQLIQGGRVEIAVGQARYDQDLRGRVFILF